eukprot:TRINITY_DN22721_c0_g1_i1.p1 TRINITY_DN22721_c0_g1~~TRINITY_DN22721_c0_g1_i1.p1  ORF type:complete len:144 (+),score=10.89 TRINITY_DN22721_c0_g1_i1:139-570(+)
MIGFNQTTAAINLTLDNFGILYVMYQPMNTRRAVPTSFQVANGLDSRNTRYFLQTCNITTPNITFTITLSGLKPNTQYSVFFTTGSTTPDFPDLLPSSKVKEITISTTPEQTPTTNNENPDATTSNRIKGLSLLVLVLAISSL